MNKLSLIDQTIGNHDLLAELQSIKTNTSNINVNVDSLEVNTDGLETLVTAGNNTLSSIDNKVILPSVLDSDRLKVYDSAVIGSLAQINNNVDGVEGKLDTINTTLTGGGVVDTSALATHAKQDTINSTLGDTNSKIDAMRGSSDLGVINTSLGTVNTTLGDTNSKIDAMRGSSDLGVINTSLGTVNSTLGDTNSKIDAMRASDTLTTVKGVLDTINTSLTNVSTDNSILSMRVREDEAHVNRQYLIGCGVVRQDTLASLCDTDNDTTMLSVNSSGALYTQPASHEVSLHSTDRTHLSEIEGAVETIEGCVGFNKMNINLSSDAVGLATQATLNDAEVHLGNIDTGIDALEACVGSNKVNVNISSGNITGFATQTTLNDAEVHLGNIDTGIDVLEACVGSNKVNVNVSSGSVAVTNAGTFACQIDGNALTSLQLIDDAVHSEDAPHSNGDKGFHVLAVRKDTQTSLAGSDADYSSLQTNSTGALRVHNNKTYSAETSIVSSQSVSGSGTHTTGAITNDANISSYLVERNFSGSDVSFEILEALTSSGSYFNAMGMTFNDAGDPSAGQTGISNIEIKSPFFKVKFTNGNASSRDVTLSYVAIKTA